MSQEVCAVENLVKENPVTNWDLASKRNFKEKFDCVGRFFVFLIFFIPMQVPPLLFLTLYLL
jgi:hypothetical protein